MEKIYQLNKIVYTEADFNVMSWHDCPIHAISFTKESKLILDIDYIFKWVLIRNKRNYQFWIAPCTLVFENVYNIAIDSNYTTLIIDNISKENPQKLKNSEYIGKDFEFDWIIETTVGELNFKSVGYIQYVRQKPILLKSQEISMEIRGGVSFDTSFTKLS